MREHGRSSSSNGRKRAKTIASTSGAAGSTGHGASDNSLPTVLITGDVQSAIASVITDKSGSDPYMTGFNRTVKLFTKFSGAVGMEAQMLALMYETFPRSYYDAETLHWEPLTDDLQPTLKVIGPSALDTEAYGFKGYELDHTRLTQEYYDIQCVGVEFGEHIFRRSGARSLHKPIGGHAEFRGLPSPTRTHEDPAAILINIDCLDFLTKEAHLSSLSAFASPEPTGENPNPSPAPWFVIKLRWTGVDDEFPENQIKNLSALLDHPSIAARTAVVLSADSLRRSKQPISQGLSWERTVQEAIWRLDNGTLKCLFEKCRIVVVTFSFDGALVQLRSNGATNSWLIYSPSTIEGDFLASTRGTTRGMLSTVSCSLTYWLVKSAEVKNLPDDSLLPVEAVKKGLEASRLSHLRGLTTTPQSSLDKNLWPGFTIVRPLLANIGPVKGEPKNNQPVDIMAEVIRAENIDLVTWVPDTSLIADPGRKTIELHRRFKRITIMLDEKYAVASKLVVNKLPGHGALKFEGKTRFEGAWWSLLTEGAMLLGKGSALEYSSVRTGMRTLAKDVLHKGASNINASSFDDKRDPKDPIIPPIPLVQYAEFVAVERREIETFREVFQLIKEAEKTNLRGHLNIAVFGEPGSGKSFAIKEILKALNSDIIHPIPIVKDVSQFTSPRDLDQAFREIADVVLNGKYPIVFWDEYDSNKDQTPFGWLQGFLEPMQSRQHSSGTIGRSIFIFAGSRFKSSDEVTLADLCAAWDFYGWPKDGKKDVPVQPESLGPWLLANKGRVPPAEVRMLGALLESQHPSTASFSKFEAFARAKGRDFKSRITRTVDVIGVNSKGGQEDPHDLSYLVKRAMIARDTLWRSFPTLFTPQTRQGRLSITDSVVNAILSDVSFIHGARSLETVLRSCTASGADTLTPSHMPSDVHLRMHIDDVAVFESSYES